VGRLFYNDPYVEIHLGDAREILASLQEDSIQVVVTSPP